MAGTQKEVEAEFKRLIELGTPLRHIPPLSVPKFKAGDSVRVAPGVMGSFAGKVAVVESLSAHPHFGSWGYDVSIPSPQGSGRVLVTFPDSCLEDAEDAKAKAKANLKNSVRSVENNVTNKKEIRRIIDEDLTDNVRTIE